MLDSIRWSIQPGVSPSYRHVIVIKPQKIMAPKVHQVNPYFNDQNQELSSLTTSEIRSWQDPGKRRGLTFNSEMEQENLDEATGHPEVWSFVWAQAISGPASRSWRKISAP